MSLLDHPTPPKPDYFGPDGAPPGVAIQLDAFATLNDGYQWVASRPTIKPRVGVVHTNAASRESSLAGQIGWGRNTSTGDGRNTTKPHYCVNAPQPTKVLRTDLRAIANSTGSDVERFHGERDASFWTIAIETADAGTLADPGVSDFLYDHAEIVARIIAYESIVWGIPVEIPTVWNSSGWVTHTWPFPYPHFTTKPGKSCPGDKKKATFRNQIMPRAAQIVAAWTAIAPPTESTDPEEPDMKFIKFTKGAGPAYEVTGNLARYLTPETWAALGSPDPDQVDRSSVAGLHLLNECPREDRGIWANA